MYTWENMIKEDSKIIRLMYILKDFNEFLPGIRYIKKYNYKLRGYEYELHKLNENTIYMYLMHNKIEIIKKNENKFEVTINFNDFQSIAEKRRLTKFMMIDNTPFFESLVYFKGNKIYFRFKDLWYVYRDKKNIAKLTFVKKTEKYYLVLPELQKRPLPEREYGFPIIPGLLYLNKINDRKVTDIIEYYKKKYKGMPYFLRLKLKNRKIEYAIFKMMINKNIIKYDKSIEFDKHTLTHLKIENYDIETYKFEFTNMFVYNDERLHGIDFPLAKDIIIQDYDYDTVNQMLLKIITPYKEVYLCGIDYRNDLWCVRLSNFMLKYKIKSVYRVLYDLDENTKVFEF